MIAAHRHRPVHAGGDRGHRPGGIDVAPPALAAQVTEALSGLGPLSVTRRRVSTEIVGRPGIPRRITRGPGCARRPGYTASRAARAGLLTAPGCAPSANLTLWLSCSSPPPWSAVTRSRTG